jgi:serine/threonine protein kinase
MDVSQDNNEVDSRQLEIQTITGRFLLKKRIGSGSFGEIYLADDSLNNMSVAVKTEHIETTVPQLPSE